MTERLWRASDVAKHLNTSTANVHIMAKDGRLPSVRLGPRTVRFDPAAIRSIVNGGTTPPTAEELRRSRAASNLPPTISDRDALRRVAALLTAKTAGAP